MWRIVGWGFAGAVLLFPLVAMRFSQDVNWTHSDFIFAGVLIGGVGLAFELTVRLTRNGVHRAAVAAALAATLLTIWINGAVGMIGSENNPYNLYFLGVIGVALAGAILARFRAAGMVWAMVAAAIAQLLVAIGGMPSDMRGGVLSAVFAGIWLIAAALFWKAGNPNGIKAAQAR